MKNYYLILENNEVFKGVAVDQQQAHFPDQAGEIVFNTSHSGYEEIATDPSYHNQIVVMTAPMQGNYGAHNHMWESQKIWIKGFVCLQMQSSSSNSTWKTQLVQNNVPILTEVDTRTLVIQLRELGTPWGALVSAYNEAEALEKAHTLIKKLKSEDQDWVWQASRKEIQEVMGENPNGPKVAVLDFGSKENILRELKKRCSHIKIFPSRTDVQYIEIYKPDAMMLTNGPGDPSQVKIAVQTIQAFMGRIPIFGICMGHQVLSLALGAKTFKLKFGHRGANHPIKDNILQKIYMSSQNHGYAVQADTLPAHVMVTHINLNDNSVAGFFSEKFNCLGIQYHPESHPGPHDAVELFDFFINKMLNKGK